MADEAAGEPQKKTWCVTWRGVVFHDVVVDAATEEEAKELAGDHFDDNADYYGDDDENLADGGNPLWDSEPDMARVIGEPTPTPTPGSSG
jgi:hypothetical protein